MLLRETPDLAGGRLRRRDPNDAGVRCAEAQADGLPCSDPHCDCERCARAYEPVPDDRAPSEAVDHA